MALLSGREEGVDRLLPVDVQNRSHSHGRHPQAVPFLSRAESISSSFARRPGSVTSSRQLSSSSNEEQMRNTRISLTAKHILFSAEE